jgi:selenium-binding protein 1
VTPSSKQIWNRDNGKWGAKKVIEIPAEPADPDLLPPILQGFKAVPPLVTDLNLSLDDKWLYVSCWGTGELRRYDVSLPDDPKLTSAVQIGGIVRQASQPGDPSARLNGGPQMVELSRDGKRVYLTNSLYAGWDEQFYPEGIRTWMVKADVLPGGSLRFDPKFFVTSREHRLHQVHLDSGDTSSDSYCYPS